MDGVRFDYNNQDELESRIALGEGAFNICTRTNSTTTPLLSMTYPPPVLEESRSVLLFFWGGGRKRCRSQEATLCVRS